MRTIALVTLVLCACSASSSDGEDATQTCADRVNAEREDLFDHYQEMQAEPLTDCDRASLWIDFWWYNEVRYNETGGPFWKQCNAHLTMEQALCVAYADEPATAEECYRGTPLQHPSGPRGRYLCRSTP